MLCIIPFDVLLVNEQIWYQSSDNSRYSIDFINITRLESTGISTVNREKIPFLCYDYHFRHNITDCLSNSSTTNSILRILFSTRYPAGCISTPCRQNFVEDTRQRITQSNRRMSLPVAGSDGRTLDMDMNLCSVNQTRASMSFAKYNQMNLFMFDKLFDSRVYREIQPWVSLFYQEDLFLKFIRFYCTNKIFLFSSRSIDFRHSTNRRYVFQSLVIGI